MVIFHSYVNVMPCFGKPGYPHLPRRENAILFHRFFSQPQLGDPEKTPGDSPMRKLKCRPSQGIPMENHHFSWKITSQWLNFPSTWFTQYIH